MSSYGKNQKKLRKRLEEMGQKEHFLPKTTKLWPKSRKREFLPGICFSPFFKRPKNQLLWQKSEKIKVTFGRKGPKRAFLAKNGQILTKKSKTRIFARNFFSPYFKRPKNQFLCQKSEKIKVAFGRKGPKRAFLVKNGQILTKNGQKVENENFRQKSETSQI